MELEDETFELTSAAVTSADVTGETTPMEHTDPDESEKGTAMNSMSADLADLQLRRNAKKSR